MLLLSYMYVMSCNTLCVGVSNAYYVVITHGQSDLLEVGFPLSVLRAVV